MKGAASFFVALAATQGLASASPAIQASQPNDPKYVGYLGAFFLGDQPNVYFDLSNGNDPISFSPLNGGNPILTPTLGTGGVRDPSLVLGAGKELGKKYYIIGTDLNIGKTDWDTAQRHGSLSIHIWESTDLINWGNERLVKVENDSAGMVWAPDAIWDPEKGQYLVHWASKFYPASDPNHSGAMGPDMIRYAHTSDFVTFTEPATWIDESPWSIIDNNLLTIAEGQSYARFLKNESATNVYMERSDTGLFGTWYRPGGPGAYITSGVEGPASYWDNEIEGKAHLLLDYYGGDGYHPFETTDINANAWVPSDRTNFPTGRRHGSVIGVDKKSYDSLKAATWS